MRGLKDETRESSKAQGNFESGVGSSGAVEEITRLAEPSVAYSMTLVLVTFSHKKFPSQLDFYDDI